jgi:hypothetical protein
VTPRRWSFAGWRDTVLFLTGIGLIINEAVLRSGPERPSLLILYGGMVGLPAILRVDEKRSSTPDKPEPEHDRTT